jgi:hypothetical protein
MPAILKSRLQPVGERGTINSSMMLWNGRPVKPGAWTKRRTGMKIELTTPILALPRDGLIALRDAEGTRVTTLKGALWITQDSQQGDVILEEGQRPLSCSP